MELGLLEKRAEKIPPLGIPGENTISGLDDEFRLIPDNNFSCSGNMTGLS